MTAVSEVLFAVARELAKQAKDSLPELQDGEKIQREWLDSGIYYRETMLRGQTFISQYDFKQRKRRQIAVKLDVCD